MLPENASVKSSIWVVEHLAYFPDGGNQEEYYHNSVRTIIELGDSMSGAMDVTLPAAYDGDDLEIHLIHEVVLPAPANTIPNDNENDDDDSDDDGKGLPSIGLVAVLAMTMFAAITVQRKQR
jgi:hypothetical protein